MQRQNFSTRLTQTTFAPLTERTNQVRYPILQRSPVSAAGWCALLLLSSVMAWAEPAVRTVHLKELRSAPKRSGRLVKEHTVIGPAGKSGFNPSAPINIVRVGNTAVGIYANPMDAQSSDYVSYRGGPIIDNAQVELVFWGFGLGNHPKPVGGRCHEGGETDSVRSIPVADGAIPLSVGDIPRRHIRR